MTENLSLTSPTVNSRFNKQPPESRSESSAPVEYEPCDRTMEFRHRLTGESIHKPCGTYGCKSCGRIKRAKFAASVANAFDNERFAAMWTLDASCPDTVSHEKHTAVMLLAWRLFTRRLSHGVLGDAGIGLRYVRVCETTERGYLHYHLVVNRFIWYGKFKAVWDACVRDAHSQLYSIDECVIMGGVFVSCSDETVRLGRGYIIRYISKYMAKATHIDGRCVVRRRWSASRGFVVLYRRVRRKGAISMWFSVVKKPCLVWLGLLQSNARTNRGFWAKFYRRDRRVERMPFGLAHAVARNHYGGAYLERFGAKK